MSHWPPIALRFAAVVAAAMALAIGPAARAAAAPPLETLDGTPLRLSAAPVVLAFWRADCAPCLIELGDARAYADAARPGRILFVGLQDPAALRAAAIKAQAPLGLIAHGIGASASILTAMGGAPPRLPLAVAFDPSGRICARHTGLLGTDQVRAWAKACGAVHARS